MRTHPLRLLAILLALCGSGQALAQADPDPDFVDAVDHPGNSQGWEAFEDLQARLVHDFDQICGDSFCGGEFSDYRSLRYRCSVHRASGVLAECVWTFGASELSVQPRSGKLLVDTRTWRCRTPLAAGTTLTAFYAALSVTNPLFEPLPGSGRSIYDGLIDCL
ncbi:hypothetical protein HF319_03365 [Xanthomonas sp. Kuri4-1]